jgi:hypothetical protein
VGGKCLVRKAQIRNDGRFGDYLAVVARRYG